MSGRRIVNGAREALELVIAAKVICARENEIWDEISDAMKSRFIREASAAQKEPRHD